jgi:hypothetical protein
MKPGREFALPELAPRHGGIALLDCVVYIALLGLILGLAFQTFYEGHEQHVRLERGVSGSIRALRAGEAWRADVRAAIAGMQLVREEGGDRLHLRRADGNVAYVFRNGAVFRRGPDSTNWQEFLPAVKASRFERDPRSRVTAWRWEVEVHPGRKPLRTPLVFTFLATAPGVSQP